MKKLKKETRALLIDNATRRIKEIMPDITQDQLQKLYNWAWYQIWKQNKAPLK